jgi:ArsR family transcriptional regulator, arsenate/arsenite/antimonite-responsive transcriptional repressor
MLAGVAALGEPQAMELVAMFKALGDPVRLRLLSLIASHPDREACVCESRRPLTVASQ